MKRLQNCILPIVWSKSWRLANIVVEINLSFHHHRLWKPLNLWELLHVWRLEVVELLCQNWS
jgi:hypothetical protein